MTKEEYREALKGLIARKLQFNYYPQLKRYKVYPVCKFDFMKDGHYWFAGWHNGKAFLYELKKQGNNPFTLLRHSFYEGYIVETISHFFKVDSEFHNYIGLYLADKGQKLEYEDKFIKFIHTKDIEKFTDLFLHNMFLKEFEKFLYVTDSMLGVLK